MKSASVLIIGGGVIGASIAYHLALKDHKNIVVIDRGATHTDVVNLKNAWIALNNKRAEKP